MALQRMDNVLIVVEDLEAAIAFFTELGMELEGRTTVEGEWVGRASVETPARRTVYRRTVTSPVESSPCHSTI